MALEYDDRWGIHLASVAARDPALAAILAHQHDCIEATKSNIVAVRDDVHELKSDAKTARNAAVGTLITILLWVAAQFVMHLK